MFPDRQRSRKRNNETRGNFSGIASSISKEKEKKEDSGIGTFCLTSVI